MQFITPAILGVLVAMQFKMNGMESVIIGAATFLGSGAYQVTETGIQLVGIGDLINVMLISAIAVFVTRLLQGKLGSLTLILMPIIVGVGAGTLDLVILPYVGMITSSIGDLINSFTTLQPLLMAVLISAAFAILIISPISTVAIGIAVGVAGSGAGVYFLTIQGTPQTAGFGIVGSVGPIQAYNMGTSLMSVLAAYVIIPFVGGFVSDFICSKLLHVYENEIFKFIPALN